MQFYSTRLRELMDREAWNEWRERRGDEPGSYMAVTTYITNKYSSEEWRASTVNFIEKVEEEAKDVLKKRGPSGLRNDRDLIGEHVEKQREEYQGIRFHKSGFELIATEIRLRYSNCTGRVKEDLRVVPRGALVRDPDGGDGLDGLKAPDEPLVLRPSGDEYILEPTVRRLEMFEMPTDVPRHYSFSVLKVSDEDSWAEVTSMVKEQVEFQKEVSEKARNELRSLQARREVYDVLLERRAKGKQMPWEAAPELYRSTSSTPTADDIMEEFRGSGVRVCGNWEKKKDLKEWAIENVTPTPSASTVKRRLEDIGVWKKGKQGSPGSGLEATVRAMKTYAGAE